MPFGYTEDFFFFLNAQRIVRKHDSVLDCLVRSVQKNQTYSGFRVFEDQNKHFLRQPECSSQKQHSVSHSRPSPVRIIYLFIFHHLVQEKKSVKWNVTMG